MKITKQQIKDIIKEEMEQVIEGGGHYGLGPQRADSSMSELPDESADANQKMMQEKAMDIIMAMSPNELRELLLSPVMKMAFERLMGMGKY
tara:strand:+ start:235 stop:507 length:273 start_codon:yes stop_codon:yes gene_type:complete